MRLILVTPGHADAGGASLSDHGRNHAAAIGRELAGLVARSTPIEVIYTSANPAANETASVISAALGGVRMEAHTRFDEANVDIDDQPALLQLQDECWASVEELLEAHAPDAALVVVTHEMQVRLLVCRALGMPLDDMRRFSIDPASLSTLEFRLQPQRRTIVAGLNETCHLE